MLFCADAQQSSFSHRAERPSCAPSLHDLDLGQVQTVHSCRFVIEATVEENVQRLSGQRAAAMDLSAAVGSRVKQIGQREPLTVRYVVATSHHQSHMELHT